MKLLLIWPKARTDPDWGGDLGAIAEPLALEYLGAGALDAGHDVRILDLRLHPGTLDQVLRDYRPDLVGVTAFSMHVRAALAVCSTVKAILPDCITVAGGHHATFLPEDFFEPAIDFVVSGEGVASLVQLMAELEGSVAAAPIPGTWRRGPDGVFARDAEPNPVTATGLPFPARHLTATDRAAYFIDWMMPVACIRSSVGCPYRCSFCSLWKMTGGHYHRGDPDSFVEELAMIPEDYVFLVDDEAFINRQRMLSLAEKVKAAGIRKRFFAYARVDTIIRQQDSLRAWREIGLERLFVGIDGAFASDLVTYNKGYEEHSIDQALAIAEDLGIEILAQLVINTNYDLADFKRLVRFVERHRLRYPSFTVLTPLPGTSLLENFDAITVRQPNGRPDWDYFDTQNAVTATRLPPDEFRRAYRNLFRLYGRNYGAVRNKTKNMAHAEAELMKLA